MEGSSEEVNVIDTRHQLLQFIMASAQRAGDRLGWSQSFVEKMACETKIALFLLAQCHTQSLFSVSPAIDQVWHEMLMETQLYDTFCSTILKKKLHHSLSGSHDPLHMKHERQKRLMSLYTWLMGDIRYPECWTLEEEPVSTAVVIPKRKKRLRQAEHITIIVKRICSDATDEVECHVDDSIATVKQKISAITHVPAAQIGLVSAGRRLSDDNTLSDYNIRDDSILHMILRISGC